MEQKHIVLINQFYPPASAPTGRLLRDLAFAIDARHHRVSVITSAGLYGGKARDDADGRMTVYRLGKARRHDVTLFAKLLDYGYFFMQAGRLLRSMRPAPDVVICLTTPPFCGLLAARLKKKRKIPFVLWCMDLYPEALVAAELLQRDGWLYGTLSRFGKAERTTADRIISLGPDMTRRLSQSVSSEVIHEVPVWSELMPTPRDREKAVELRRQRGWGDDECILMYSGNMGRAHRIDAFAELSAYLNTQERAYRLVFCGSGPEKKSWMEQYPAFEWLKPVDEVDLTAHLLSADIHLISQDAAWNGIVVPSKYQAAVATGKPVLFAGTDESAIAHWIKQYGGGLIMHPGSADSIKRAAEELGAGRLAGNAENPFSKSELTGQLYDIVMSCVEAP